MSWFVGGEEKIIDVNNQIVFENKTDSNFEVGAGIIFHNSGLYDISISENRVVVTKVSEPRWIPVEVKPPEKFNRYWVCTDTGYQCECRWTRDIFSLGISGDWGWSIFDIPQYTKVIAYMPLPEPYKRREE